MTILLPKEIAEFLAAEIMGCHFVGLSSDNEVFIEFDHEDSALEVSASRALRAKFPVIEKVTVVVRPSIQQLTEMIEELNKFIDDEPKKPLLDIESF